MKQFFFILSSATAFGLLAYFLVGQFAGWYGPRYIQSDEDISKVFLVFLVVVAAVALAGGIVGRYIYKKITFGRNDSTSK